MNLFPGHTEFRDRPKSVLLALAVALVGLIAVGASMRVAWRFRKLHLAKQFCEQAQAARQKGDWSGTYAALRAAHGLAPAEPDVQRGFAQFYSTFRSSDGLAFWKLLDDSGALTPEDRLSFARLALDLHRSDLARKCLAPFAAGQDKSPAGLLLVSELLATDGDFLKARAAVEAAAEAGADPQAVELRIADLEARGSNRSDWARSKSRLLGLVMTKSRLRAEAAVLLISRGLAFPADERLISKLLPRGEDSTFRDRTVGLVLDLRRDPGSFQRLVREFATHNRLLSPTPDLIFAGETLAQTDQHRALLELIPEKLSLSDERLCRLRLGALAVVRDHSGTDRLLSAPGIPVPASHLAVFRAGAAQLAGRTNEVRNLWSIAMDACRRDPQALELLASNAESLGALTAAIEARRILLLDPSTSARAADELMRLGSLSRDPNAILAALRRMVQLNPLDRESRLALAYCQLLLQTDESAARETLAMGASAFQNRDFYQIVAALDALRRKEVELAMTAIEAPSLAWENSPVSWRVIRAATLGRAGLGSRAREAAATLKPEELSAQEMELVRAWLPDTRPDPSVP